MAGVGPFHPRAAAGLAPVALQVGLQAVVPFAGVVAVAGVGAIAVGRTVVGFVLVIAAVVVGRGVLVGVVAVGVLVGAIGAVGAVEGVTHRLAGLVPAQARAVLGRLPAQAGLRLAGVGPHAAAVPLPPGTAGAVGRGGSAVVRRRPRR